MSRPFDPEFDILYAAAVAQAGDDPRRLRRLFASGHLHRIRRGAYVLTTRWATADERQQHLAHVYAAAHDARGEFIVAGLSAASVWRVPVFRNLGVVVEVLDAYRGGGGVPNPGCAGSRQRPISRHRSCVAVSMSPTSPAR